MNIAEKLNLIANNNYKLSKEEIINLAMCNIFVDIYPFAKYGEFYFKYILKDLEVEYAFEIVEALRKKGLQCSANFTSSINDATYIQIYWGDVSI